MIGKLNDKNSEKHTKKNPRRKNMKAKISKTKAMCEQFLVHNCTMQFRPLVMS